MSAYGDKAKSKKDINFTEVMHRRQGHQPQRFEGVNCWSRPCIVHGLLDILLDITPRRHRHRVAVRDPLRRPP